MRDVNIKLILHNLNLTRSFGHREKIVYLGKQVKKGVLNDRDKWKETI